MMRNNLASQIVGRQYVSKGKSFRFSTWKSEGTYVNNDEYQDFVSYAGKMWACLADNIGKVPADNPDKWVVVVDAEKGESGTTFTPSVDAAGNISWTSSDGTQPPVTTNIRGPKGESLEFAFDGFKLGVKTESDEDYTWSESLKGPGLEFNVQGDRIGVRKAGDEDYVYTPSLTGPKSNIRTVMRVDNGAIQYAWSDQPSKWIDLLDISTLKGEQGAAVILEREPVTGNLVYRYAGQTTDDNILLASYDQIKGADGRAIAETLVGSDGYLYVQYTDDDKYYRAGYVRGDRGADGRQLELRVDEDGMHIQWKWAGDSFKTWTNLISVEDLLRKAIMALKIETSLVSYPDHTGQVQEYERIELNYYNFTFDDNGKIVYTDKILTVSHVDLPLTSITDVQAASDFTAVPVEDVDQIAFEAIRDVIVYKDELFVVSDKKVHKIVPKGQAMAIYGNDSAALHCAFEYNGELYFGGASGLWKLVGDTVEQVQLLAGFANGKPLFAGDTDNGFMYVNSDGMLYAAEDGVFKAVKSLNARCATSVNGRVVYGSVGVYELDSNLEAVQIISGLDLDAEKVISLQADDVHNNLWIATEKSAYLYVSQERFVKVCDNPFVTQSIKTAYADSLLWSSGHGIYSFNSNVPTLLFTMNNATKEFITSSGVCVASDDQYHYMWKDGYWTRLALDGNIVDAEVFEGNVYIFDENHIHYLEIKQSTGGYLRKPGGWMRFTMNGEDVDQFGNFTIQSDDNSIIIESIENGLNAKLDIGIVDERIEGLNVKRMTDYPDDTVAAAYILEDVNGEQRGEVITVWKDKFLKSVEFDEESGSLVFTFNIADGSESTVHVPLDIVDTYDTQIADGLQMPEAVGGIIQGTTAGSLKGKTFTQLFDDLLFPTVQPTITAPSIKDLFNPPAWLKVGEAYPECSDSSATFSRGTASVLGQPDRYRAGEGVISTYTEPADKIGRASVYGETVKYIARADYEEGDLLLDNKGNIATVDPNPLPAGSITKEVASITSVYAFKCNGLTASSSNAETSFPSSFSDTLQELPLQSNTTLYGVKFASEAEHSKRCEFGFRKEFSVSKCDFYNTATRAWEPFSTYETKADSDTDWMIWTTTGNYIGQMQFRLQFTYNG